MLCNDRNNIWRIRNEKDESTIQSRMEGTEMSLNFNQPKEKKYIPPAQMGKACNQALQVILHSNKNIKTSEVQEEYLKLAELFLELDEQLTERVR